MVDNGVLRLNEAKQVHEMLNKDLGVNLTVVDASDLFLSRLQGVEDPEQKRKTIGERFIRTFEKAQADIILESADDPHATDVKFLVQGTLYPDVVESGGGDGTANIKSHHNVGGLLKDMRPKLIEPLRELFKGAC